jgi:hypothetical protein
VGQTERFQDCVQWQTLILTVLKLRVPPPQSFTYLIRSSLRNFQVAHFSLCQMLLSTDLKYTALMRNNLLIMVITLSNNAKRKITYKNMNSPFVEFLVSQ